MQEEISGLHTENQALQNHLEQAAAANHGLEEELASVKGSLESGSQENHDLERRLAQAGIAKHGLEQELAAIRESTSEELQNQEVSSSWHLSRAQARVTRSSRMQS